MREVHITHLGKAMAIILMCLLSLGSFGQSALQNNTNILFPAAIMTATSQTSAVIHMGQSPSGNGGSYSTGTITVTGVALTTATFAVNGSSDGGKTYYALSISALNAPATTATTQTVTTAGVYQVNLSGITDVQFVTSGTFTATSISLTLTASPNGIIARSGSGGGSSGAMTLIQKQTLGSSAASITFSSIPQTYSGLYLVVTGLNTAGALTNLIMQFNGDTGGNYSVAGVYSQGASPANYSASNTTAANIGQIDNFGNSTTNCWLNNYSSTTVNKTGNSTSTAINPTFNIGYQAGGFVWNSTAAITSIVLASSSGNLAANTVATLYGVQ